MGGKYDIASDPPHQMRFVFTRGSDWSLAARCPEFCIGRCFRVPSLLATESEAKDKMPEETGTETEHMYTHTMDILCTYVYNLQDWSPLGATTASWYVSALPAGCWGVPNGSSLCTVGRVQGALWDKAGAAL